MVIFRNNEILSVFLSFPINKMEKISDFRYKELDQKQIPAEEEERPNVKYFKQKVIGNVVKVTLSDGR